jgi:hypothetical protein
VTGEDRVMGGSSVWYSSTFQTKPRSDPTPLPQDEIEFRDKNEPLPVVVEQEDLLPPEGKSCCSVM